MESLNKTLQRLTTSLNPCWEGTWLAHEVGAEALLATTFCTEAELVGTTVSGDLLWSLVGESLRPLFLTNDYRLTDPVVLGNKISVADALRWVRQWNSDNR
jgi:hypothetical protein